MVAPWWRPPLLCNPSIAHQHYRSSEYVFRLAVQPAGRYVEYPGGQWADRDAAIRLWDEAWRTMSSAALGQERRLLELADELEE